MIHIVFEQDNIATLNKVIALDEILQGEIVEIKDDFAVGPINNIYEVEGYQARRDWWKGLLEHTPYIDQINLVDDKLCVAKLIRTLNENSTETVWIWMAQNAHDVCSYYWLIEQLKDFMGRVQILYLNNLPFFHEKGHLFYPTHLHQIQPKEFLKAKKLARHITPSEFEIDPDEWTKLCNDNSMIRILEGGKKIANKPNNFYDKDLLDNITIEFQKLSKILHNTLGKMKVQTGDVFLVYRIKTMIDLGTIAATGNWEKGWKDIEIALAN
jgi:Domain of unknown function (DUF1835)/Protein of unknown function